MNTDLSKDMENRIKSEFKKAAYRQKLAMLLSVLISLAPTLLLIPFLPLSLTAGILVKLYTFLIVPILGLFKGKDWAEAHKKAVTQTVAGSGAGIGVAMAKLSSRITAKPAMWVVKKVAGA